ncbi:MAG: hypothetical protein LBK97_08115, partial [Prevotellaceae bacterium]|nr:hypothetical protein [Prevotellaceae bacterium]
HAVFIHEMGKTGLPVSRFSRVFRPPEARFVQFYAVFFDCSMDNFAIHCDLNDKIFIQFFGKEHEFYCHAVCRYNYGCQTLTELR